MMGVKEIVASTWDEWVGMSPRQFLSQGVNLGASEKLFTLLRMAYLRI